MNGPRGLLGVVVLLAIGLRFQAGPLSGCAIEIPEIQRDYRDIGSNVAQGRGYSLSSTTGPVTPNGYYLPGYAFLIAPIQHAFGDSCASAQAFNTVLDGTLGPVLASLLLGAFGLTLAAPIAALLYALSPPLIHSTTLTAPDALGVVLFLAPAVTLLWGLRLGVPRAAAVATGLLIGAAVWFRAEMLALLPGLILVVAVMRRPRRQQLVLASLMVAGWLIATAPLAAFWQQHHGYLSISRPGVGIRLWTGVYEGTGVFEPGMSDEVAQELLSARGITYGTAEGDAQLFRDAVDRVVAAPDAFITRVFVRGALVVSTFDGLPLAGLAGILLVAHRLPLLAAVLAVLWLARAIPFSLLYHQERDLVPLVAVTVLTTAYAIERLFVLGSSRPLITRSG